MKKAFFKNSRSHLSLLIVLLLSSSHLYAQSLFNSDFETWKKGLKYEEPDSWNSDNPQVSAIPGNTDYTVGKTADAQSGSAAVLLETKYYSQIGWIIPGLLTNGQFALNPGPEVSGGRLFKGRPKSIRLWYKFFPTGDDSFVVYSALIKWDPAGHKRDTIAEAIYERPDSAVSYTLLDVPFKYRSNGVPDSIIVVFLTPFLEFADVGSRLYIDNVHFTGLTGLEEPAEERLQLYPNPARHYVSISLPQPILKIEMIDLYGKKAEPALERRYGTAQINLEGLAKGIYIVRVFKENKTLVEKLLIE